MSPIIKKHPYFEEKIYEKVLSSDRFNFIYEENKYFYGFLAVWGMFSAEASSDGKQYIARFLKLR